MIAHDKKKKKRRKMKLREIIICTVGKMFLTRKQIVKSTAALH